MERERGFDAAALLRDEGQGQHGRLQEVQRVHDSMPSYNYTIMIAYTPETDKPASPRWSGRAPGDPHGPSGRLLGDAARARADRPAPRDTRSLGAGRPPAPAARGPAVPGSPHRPPGTGGTSPLTSAADAAPGRRAGDTCRPRVPAL